MYPERSLRRIPNLAIFCLSLWAAQATSLQAADPDRLWVSRDGQYLRGQFVELRDETVVLEDRRLRQFAIDLDDLSIEDQRHAEQLHAARQAERPTTLELPPPQPTPDSADDPPEATAPESPPIELPKPLRNLKRLLQGNRNSLQAGAPGFFGPNASVYIAFSAKFLNEFIQVPFDHQRAVDETILGAPVAGTADTRGVATLSLIPNKDHAAFDIVVKGHADSYTAGQQLLVNIESDGSTDFEARKRVEISTSGIDLFEARASAKTVVKRAAVSTPVPGRIGALVGRIAGTIVEANRPQIDYEASQKAAYRAAQELDERIDREVVRLQQLLAEIAPGLKSGEPAVPIRFRTSKDHLAILVGDNEPEVWQEFEDHVHQEGEDIVVVLPKNTVASAQQLDMALKLMSIRWQDQLGVVAPEELEPHTQTWSEDRKWLTLSWDVDGTVVEVLSKDFLESTAGALTQPPAAAPAARATDLPQNVPSFNGFRPRRLRNRSSFRPL